MNNRVTEDRSVEATSQDDHQSTENRSRSNAQPSKAASEERIYQASIYPVGDSTIPTDFARKVLRLEKAYSKEYKVTTQIWLLVQARIGDDEAGTGPYGALNEEVRRAFFAERRKLSKNAQIVLLIDSLGGSAKSAYQLAMFFRRYCKRFIALVPRSAKSAATLLAIGADEIILGNSGELGPVDAQVRERDGYVPALDRVKALERLHASALEALDRTMALLTLRSGEDIDNLLPRALEFAASLSEPTLQGTNMLDYTRMSRVLKIGEDYATNLLERQYTDQESSQPNGIRATAGDDHPNPQTVKRAAEDMPLEDELFGDYSRPSRRRARLIAQHLVGAYPDHAFAIDAEEAKRIRLQVVQDTPQHISLLIDELHQIVAERAQEGLTAIGRVVEVKGER